MPCHALRDFWHGRGAGEFLSEFLVDDCSASFEAASALSLRAAEIVWTAARNERSGPSGSVAKCPNAPYESQYDTHQFPVVAHFAVSFVPWRKTPSTVSSLNNQHR